jgi:nucleoside-diphosphate-sugar epimerase
VQLVGDVDQSHSWTAPVDVARTLITVANDPRGWGRAWHVPSNPPRTQRQAVQDLAGAAGVPSPKVSSVPRAVLWGLGLVQPVIRELRETDYQRERPYLLDDSAARSVFGLEPTPWSDLLAQMVAHYRERSLAA